MQKLQAVLRCEWGVFTEKSNIALMFLTVTAASRRRDWTAEHNPIIPELSVWYMTQGIGRYPDSSGLGLGVILSTGCMWKLFIEAGVML